MNQRQQQQQHQQRRMIRHRMERMSYEAILEHVNIEVGYFSIGFKPQTLEYRERVRTGSTDNEAVNHVMSQSLVSEERGAPAQRNGIVRTLIGLLPAEFRITAIREVTSTYAYSHCEMAFLIRRTSPLFNAEVNVLAVGINSDCGVFIAPRRFHEEYEWHHVRCEPARMIAMLYFAYTQQGKPFSAELMTKSVVMPGPDDRSVYFCSHFTMACLEFLPHAQFQLNRANAQSVDSIYAMVTGDKEVRATNVSEIPQALFTKTFGETIAAAAALPAATARPKQMTAERDALRAAERNRL